MPRPLSATFVLLALVPGGGSDGSTAPAAPMTVDLEFDGLELLENGFHYEGWAIIDGAPLATGKFNVSQAGDIVDLSGVPIVGGSFDVGVDISGCFRSRYHDRAGRRHRRGPRSDSRSRGFDLGSERLSHCGRLAGPRE